MNEYEEINQDVKNVKTNLTKTIISAGLLIIIIIGTIGIILIIIELYKINKINLIKKWPIIKDGGTVIDYSLETARSSYSYSVILYSSSYDVVVYRNRIAFSYKIDGQEYISHKISYYEPWFSNPIQAKIENKVLEKGNKVDIRVNPRNPHEAYVYNKPYNSYSRLIVGIVFIIIGIYGIIISNKKQKNI